MSYNRYFNPAQIESDQKDLIISQLKAELFELRQSEKDFYELSAQLNNLEKRYTVLKDEKIRQEKDFKQRHEMNQNQILHLNGEIDQVKADLNNLNIDCQEVRADNEALSEMIEKKNFQIQQQKAEVFENKETENRAQEELSILQQNVKRLRVEKGNLREEQIRAQGKLEELNQDHSYLQSDLQKLQKIKQEKEGEIQQQRVKNDDLSEELENANQNLLRKEQQIQDLNKDMVNLEGEARALSKNIDKNKGEINSLSKQLKNEEAKQKQLEDQSNFLLSQQRLKDDQIEDQNKRYEALKRDNQDFREDHNILSQDVERHIYINNELHQIHSELISEVERYIEEDDRARLILSRKDKMKDLIYRSENQIQQSMNEINHIQGKQKINQTIKKQPKY